MEKKIFTLVLIINFTFVSCGFFEDRFSEIKNDTKIERKVTKAFNAMINAVYPREHNTIRNHIIPATLINKMFLKLLNTIKGRETLVVMLRHLCFHYKFKFDNLHTSDDQQISIRELFERIQNTIDCLDENMQTITVNGVELQGDALKIFCMQGFDDARAIMEWNPGNVFLSPQNRLLDGGRYRDVEARHIFPYDIYELNRNYNDIILTYLESGNESLLSDIISFNQRLISVADAMYDIAQRAIWIWTTTEEYAENMYNHASVQCREALKQLKISDKPEDNQLFDEENKVIKDNTKIRNDKLYDMLCSGFFELHNEAKKYQNRCAEFIDEYKKDPYSEDFNYRCTNFLEHLRIYSHPQETNEENNLAKSCFLLTNVFLFTMVKAISDKIERQESFSADIHEFVEKYIEVTSYVTSSTLTRMQSDFHDKLTLERPSEWVRHEGSNANNGIFRHLPINRTLAATSKPKTRKSNKPKQNIDNRPVSSKEQKFNNIKLSLERYIDGRLPYNNSDSELGFLLLFVMGLLSEYMNEIIYDYHLTDYRLTVEYYNYERHTISLENVLRDSCTINKNNRYHNWMEHLNSSQPNNIPNTGFIQFEDNSYVQQIVTNDLYGNPGNWQAVDLSFYIGLAAPVITNNFHRIRRHTTEIGNKNNIVHGLLYVDKNNRPIMVVFKTSYTTNQTMYWTDYGWSFDPKSVFLNNKLSLASEDSPTFLRCGGMPIKHNNITSSMHSTDKMLLKHTNLAIVQREFERTVNGDGFYYKSYSSWKDQYSAYSWASLRDQGEVMSGNTFKIWALGGFRFRHINYGYYFSDGSFSIGISSKSIESTDTDNWLSEAGKNIREWKDGNYNGQIFFDYNGRPVAIVLMSTFCFFKRCTWVFEYTVDNKWKWSYDEWYPSSQFSKNPDSFRFFKNNVNYGSTVE